MSSAVYDKLLTAFITELSATFPEFSTQLDRALSITPAQFIESWKKDLHILRDRNIALLLSERKGSLIGNVNLTSELFAELSDATVAAIWKYLRTILLESVKIVKLDSMDAAASQIIFGILAEEKLGSPDISDLSGYDKIKQLMNDFKPFIDKLKDMLSQFLNGDSSFDLSGLTGMAGFAELAEMVGMSPDFLNLSGLPTIPQHLLSGHIANLAKDLMKQFQPSDFGIDPSITECEDIEEIMQKLGDYIQNDTSSILAGARKLAEKIKNKILNGSVKQAELIAEAKEFMNIIQGNPLIQECILKGKAFFSEGAGKDIDLSTILNKFGLNGFGDITEMIQTFMNGFGTGAGASAPTDRRRAVQDRLRKKLAKKNEMKNANSNTK